MKICLISFDFFSFDQNIVLELKRNNIEAHHIDISKYKYRYPSFFSKLTNFLNKIFFKKNIKKIELEKDILSRLEKLGPQNHILVIRPDRLTKQTHLEIKKYTKNYIAYIYDSCTRFPVDHLLKDKIFDTIYSFDARDCKKFGFNFITNYIYLEKRAIQPLSKTNNTIFIILSIDERFHSLNKIANYLSQNAIQFKFIIIGKRKPKNCNENIIYTDKPIFIDTLMNELENSNVYLDLIRKDHNGLSFRIFEALAMQRKIITTNKSITEYDFYNPNNILVLDENEEINISPDFLNTPYKPLNEAVYYKYTIENWVKTVFKL
ncbi:hypothetical protein [Flavobacterium piscis]|uniref:Glycosyltransferase family 1 protein n=1 Tax=Flavobacterium piscis TaxID=1114874 RepID=A0ABU1Y9T1_9FLAO|nr:hypothetical protein [Flavobacterium piscis]MDR7210858.1 hypothetical protein [Flavobacterium piscis]